MATFADLRRLALALPGAEEVLTWETDLTFRVRGKIFAIGGEGGTRASIKARPDRQAELIDLDPATFASAAYVGRFGWITVDLERIDEVMLGALLTGAWRLTAPKRLVADTDRAR